MVVVVVVMLLLFVLVFGILVMPFYVVWTNSRMADNGWRRLLNVTVIFTLAVIGRRPMGKALGIAHPIPAVIFGMPLVEVAVMSNSAFHDDDIRNEDPIRGHWSAIFHAATIHRAVIIRGGKDTA